MRERSQLRRMMAIAAAYVVVLQVLLLPLSVVASARPHLPNQLCAEVAAGSSEPGHGAPACACASGCGMQCCEPAGSNPPAVAIKLDMIPAGVLSPVAVLEPGRLAPVRGPHNPRAPPAAA